ncbi:MAG: hypothetical protein JNJ54_19920 [Myxococcaceae bacterium]|nr:hypothetical protein [Myxococcaceae bacterium]
MRALFAALCLCSVATFGGPKPPPAPTPVAAAPPTYAAVLPTKSESPEYASLLDDATDGLRAELAKYDVELAPQGEDEAAGSAAVKAKKTTGVRLQLTLTAAREQMRASMLVTKLPGGGLRGSWSVHASGPSAAELVEAIVPAIVEDLAQDLGWKKRPAALP